MHVHALNEAIALYRGETLTLKQAARHAGVTRERMRTALRSHGVPLREPVGSASSGSTRASPVIGDGRPTPSDDRRGRPPAGAD